MLYHGRELCDVYLSMWVHLWHYAIPLTPELVAWGVRSAMQALSTSQMSRQGCVQDLFQYPLHMLTAWSANSLVSDTFEDAPHRQDKRMQELHPLSDTYDRDDAWLTWCAPIFDKIAAEIAVNSSSSSSHPIESVACVACQPWSLWEAYANVACTMLFFGLLAGGTRRCLVDPPHLAADGSLLHVWLTNMLSSAEQTEQVKSELSNLFLHARPGTPLPPFDWIPVTRVSPEIVRRCHRALDRMLGSHDVTYRTRVAYALRWLGHRCMLKLNDTGFNDYPVHARGSSGGGGSDHAQLVRDTYSGYRRHTAHALILAATVIQHTSSITTAHSNSNALDWLPVNIHSGTQIDHGACVPLGDAPTHVQHVFTSLTSTKGAEYTHVANHLLHRQVWRLRLDAIVKNQWYDPRALIHPPSSSSSSTSLAPARSSHHHHHNKINNRSSSLPAPSSSSSSSSSSIQSLGKSASSSTSIRDPTTSSAVAAMAIDTTTTTSTTTLAAAGSAAVPSAKTVQTVEMMVQETNHHRSRSRRGRPSSSTNDSSHVKKKRTVDTQAFVKRAYLTRIRRRRQLPCIARQPSPPPPPPPPATQLPQLQPEAEDEEEEEKEEKKEDEQGVGMMNLIAIDSD